MMKSTHAQDVPPHKKVLVVCKMCHRILLIRGSDEDDYHWFIPLNGNMTNCSTSDNYNGSNHFIIHHAHTKPIYGKGSIKDASTSWLHKKTIWYGL